MNVAFGFELLIDLYGCKKELEDVEVGYEFLEKFVAILGMQKQSPPSIFVSDAVMFPDKAGLSGWVPLIESSIVLHTLTVYKFVTIDVYCCRSFDKDAALLYCIEAWKAADWDVQWVKRGARYKDVMDTR